MKRLTDSSWLPPLALALNCAWVLAWACGKLPGMDSAASRAVSVIGAAVLFGALALWLWWQTSSKHAAARRCLETISRLGTDELAAGANLPNVSPENPWHGSLQQIRERLAALACELQDYGGSLALLELRAQRGSVAQARLRQVLAALPEPVLVLGEFGELLLANPAAMDVLGCDAKSVGERALKEIVRCERLLELLGETQKRKVSTTRSDEIALTDSAGNARQFRVNATNLVTEGESSPGAGGLGLIAVFRDVSMLKAANRRHAEFVSAVSHEMKTPLAGIKAYAEMLSDGEAKGEDMQHEFLQVIENQADRLQRLVDNLLNLARVESGVIKVNKQNLSLNALLEEAMNVLRPMAEQKGISLVPELSPLFLSVHVDRDQMMQTTINLLSNAIKYTSPAGKVTLRSRALDRQVQFEVEDTGVGLSPEDCQKVFEKFYRVQSSQEMAPGTGLGLTLAKSIVEEVHGGCISVRSEQGVGSTFTVTLPSAGAA